MDEAAEEEPAAGQFDVGRDQVREQVTEPVDPVEDVGRGEHQLFAVAAVFDLGPGDRVDTVDRARPRSEYGATVVLAGLF